MFFDLTKRFNVNTGNCQVISIIITYGSKLAVALLIEDDTTFYIRGYSLKTFTDVFSHKLEGSYLKADLIE